jgi:hypothetical protein
MLPKGRNNILPPRSSKTLSVAERFEDPERSRTGWGGLGWGLLGLVEKGIDFNVTRNAFIKKHESILQRSQAFRGPA